MTELDLENLVHQQITTTEPLSGRMVVWLSRRRGLGS